MDRHVAEALDADDNAVAYACDSNWTNGDSAVDRLEICIRQLEAISPLPLLNALPAVDAAIKQRQFKTVGIIGTRMVMQTGLYGAISTAEVIVPEGDEFELVQENYGAMATIGVTCRMTA